MSSFHIAFVSLEYAGIAAGGGIGTYVRNAAAMLAARGHRVEVFTEGPDARNFDDGAVRVHTVPVADRRDFARAVLPAFAARHLTDPFEVVEGPEYGADAAHVAEAFPDVALVVKLHTPEFLVSEINDRYVPLAARARFWAGALRRGRLPGPYYTYDVAADAERAHTLRADEITAPSRAILDVLRNRWALPAGRLAVVPNVFTPPAALLAVRPETDTRRVLFVGKLEVRKGVLDLAAAVPLVLARVPDVRFRFVGRSLPLPGSGRDLADVMRERLGRHVAAVEFVDAVPYDQIPALYAEADVCAFPSVFEAAGYVCLEAMSAARGVVASSAGGMAEMMTDGETGHLVPPNDPRALADAIADLLIDRDARTAMGRAARLAVRAFSAEAVAPVQEASYARAIARAAARTPEPVPTR